MWSVHRSREWKTARFWTNHRTDWIKLLLHNQTIPVNNVWNRLHVRNCSDASSRLSAKDLLNHWM